MYKTHELTSTSMHKGYVQLVLVLGAAALILNGLVLHFILFLKSIRVKPSRKERKFFCGKITPCRPSLAEPDMEGLRHGHNKTCCQAMGIPREEESSTASWSHSCIWTLECMEAASSWSMGSGTWDIVPLLACSLSGPQLCCELLSIGLYMFVMRKGHVSQLVLLILRGQCMA